jgi:hypothetical protein
MENTKKSFGEIWSKLNTEQTEYLKGYINRQRQDAVKHYQSEQLRLHNVVKSFYCQSNIEDGGKCDSQCDHCKEYYKPLEQ